MAHVSATDADTTGVGPLVETAIQRSPILYIRNGSVCIGLPLSNSYQHVCFLLRDTVAISTILLAIRVSSQLYLLALIPVT